MSLGQQWKRERESKRSNKSIKQNPIYINIYIIVKQRDTKDVWIIKMANKDLTTQGLIQITERQTLHLHYNRLI